MAAPQPVRETSGEPGRRVRHRRRFLGSTLLIVGVCLSLIALVTPWWTLSITNGQNTWTGYLFPGTADSSCSGHCDNLYWTCDGESDCSDASHSSGVWWNNDFENLSGLYHGILFLLIFGILAGISAVFLGLRESFRPLLGTRRALVTLLAGFFAMLFSLVASLSAVVGQPGAVSNDFKYWWTWGAWFCAPGASPTNSFWGSNSGTCGGGTGSSYPVSYSWGASVGWYAALAAALILLAAVVLLAIDWAQLRRGSRSMASSPPWGVPPPPGFAPPLPPPPPPPAPFGGAPFPPPPPPPGFGPYASPAPCPSCGMVNAPGVVICVRCQRPLG